ncbi:putative transporter YrhG [Colletotrichum tanaceti]|uniref:Putative transporter YrhG n=1 Tax=Colletotrichum tanaceti TaxID=1306861 RepID=A0A4V6DIV4_9PEZI|nr:putative transporter YrhG [Colletotrichum tanaceti]
MEQVDACSVPETCNLLAHSGVAKARLSWVDLIVKSFFGGIFISLGSGLDLSIAGGCSGLRASNPAIATMLGVFIFPIGFVLILFTNVELVTSNMAVLVYSTLQRKSERRPVSQAEGRVNTNWAYNFTRGIGCNWLVGLAVFLAMSGRDNFSKIVGIWLPIWAL